MEYVVFKVSGKKFAVPIMSVREISNQIRSTLVHGSDRRIVGLINLRGQIVTVVDLKNCLSEIKFLEDESKHYLVILNSDKNANSHSGTVLFNSAEDSIGLKVDEIDNVIDIDPAIIENSPAHLANPFISGIIRLPEELISILNSHKLMESIILENKTI